MLLRPESCSPASVPRATLRLDMNIRVRLQCYFNFHSRDVLVRVLDIGRFRFVFCDDVLVSAIFMFQVAPLRVIHSNLISPSYIRGKNANRRLCANENRAVVVHDAIIEASRPRWCAIDGINQMLNG